MEILSCLMLQMELRLLSSPCQDCLTAEWEEMGVRSHGFSSGSLSKEQHFQCLEELDSPGSHQAAHGEKLTKEPGLDPLQVQVSLI